MCVCATLVSKGLTEVEVVVLSVADSENEGNGMNDSCDKMSVVQSCRNDKVNGQANVRLAVGFLPKCLA